MECSITAKQYIMKLIDKRYEMFELLSDKFDTTATSDEINTATLDLTFYFLIIGAILILLSKQINKHD